MAHSFDPSTQLDPVSLPFDFQQRTRIIFGPGAVEKIGELAKSIGASKVLLVTDRGIVAAGHAERVRKLLQEKRVTVVSFEAVEENPSTICVQKCVALAQGQGIDLIVGLGGGSSMDTAKGCNFILTNGGRMQDYQGIGKATKPMLPLIAVPTTGGTGSECQSFALITDETTHQKMACGDPKAAARIALLDPALTTSQPPGVTACSGIDAIAHAVETAVTKARNPISLLFSRESFRLTSRALPRVIENPMDLSARGEMLLGAAFGGIAIENSMLGAAHSAANPLTAHFGISHGQAVGLMLPHVVRWNAQDPKTAAGYLQLSAAANLANSSPRPRDAADHLADELKRLLKETGLKTRLSDLGITPKDLPGLSREASSQWTARFNPLQMSETDFEVLYNKALS